MLIIWQTLSQKTLVLSYGWHKPKEILHKQRILRYCTQTERTLVKHFQKDQTLLPAVFKHLQICVKPVHNLKWEMYGELEVVIQEIRKALCHQSQINVPSYKEITEGVCQFC